MKIGIVGVGVVGAAVQHGLERLGHDVRIFDIARSETALTDVLPTELVFLCVPTPCLPNGMCDTSRVEQVVSDLAELRYSGLIAIKSTVTPGTTDRLAQRYPFLRIAFCPEFLRERAAAVDFVENHDLCIAGVSEVADAVLIQDAHGTLPKAFRSMKPTEAELAKYFSNVYNALRIVFANEFYEVCKAIGADYDAIKEAMVQRTTISDVYLDCNDRFRGFAGMCLPKDTAAFAAFVRALGLDGRLDLFRAIVDENQQFAPTVPPGMRP